MEVGEGSAAAAAAPRSVAAARGYRTRRELKFKKNEEDFEEWYEDVVVKGELIEYYQVSGCYILRPWCYSIWESIKSFLDAEMRCMGVENVYFPLFVPEKLLSKKKDVEEEEGEEEEAKEPRKFAAPPEDQEKVVAWVTKSGSVELDVPVAIRPSSETIMYHSFAKWIQSHRDLPLKLNQWCNVVRWESKDPTPFIRSKEFLWQEGHTAFGIKEEADAEVQEVLEVYCRVYEELLAVPVIQGVKSEREKFPGSLSTATVEAFVQGPRGIQGATVRSLGQHFSKAFNITFEDEAGAKKRVWQNSWELSTRAIGIMAMVHGDDRGLVLPPRVAPIQVIVIPTSGASSSSETTNADAADLSQECKSVAHLLQEGGIRSATDSREDCTPGWKNAYWEMKGVPLRIEISARDMENRQVTVARRDLAEGANGHTTVVPKHELLETVRELLDRIQRCLLESARQQRDAAMAVALNWQDFKTVWQRKKMVLAPWCDEVEAEKQVEEKLRRRCKLMLRMPYELDNNTHLSLITRMITTLSADTKCFVTGKPAKSWGLWGRSF
ncbi:unnamed protein product [Sphagnum jensenii]|uniref:proline--tRNA ligase n=1 Tax=Sphagnum jensenii TaxID=128206 RepID=A0ABP0WE51_9BRYO